MKQCLGIFLIFIISIEITTVALAQDQSTICQGKPKDQRFAALGFELGECKKEVEELLATTNEKVSESSGENLPPNIQIFSSNFLGAVPPGTPNLEYSNTSFYFYNNVLVSLLVSYSYNRDSDAETAFDTLDSVLNNKYGDGKFNKTFQISGKVYPYSKEWVHQNTTIMLHVDDKVLRISYYDTDLVLKSSKEIENFRTRKLGEGY